jgi:transketolase
MPSERIEPMHYNKVELERMAKRLRLNVVKMIGAGKTGHLGGSYSIADILSVLYFYKMKHDPRNPQWEDRDRLILSKGHSVISQYAALGECGYFPKEELWELKKLGAKLQGHPDMLKTPGIEANTGSLGQGLSIACGIAAGAKIDKRDYRVYCILGDGEIAEGQIWEASLAASFYKLDNLIAILDQNRIQATDFVTNCLNTNPYVDKWRSYGWHVMEICGHDIDQIAQALDKADEIKDQPTMIIAQTVKGKGLAFAENNPAFHNGLITKEQYDLALSVFAD